MFLCISFGNAQFQFTGQVSEEFKGREVYLSLIEDYRKTSRVYLDQIIQKTTTDSLGFFSFSGRNIPNSNRIYRIHVDGCNDDIMAQKHFLRECNATESILFIANNHDTLSLPIGDYNQAFCQITSTNPVSESLLYVEALKEEMILDFKDYDSNLGKTLNFEKWFDKFHKYAKSTSEPLVELYVFSFFSDRTNETYTDYLAFLNKGSLVIELLERLESNYPSDSFTVQFEKEVSKEFNVERAGFLKWFGITFKPVYLISIMIALLLSALLYRFFRKRYYSVSIELTSQEQKIADAIVAQKSNKEIAAELFVSLSTVKTHINNIYKKTGASSRKDLQSKLRSKL